MAAQVHGLSMDIDFRKTVSPFFDFFMLRSTSVSIRDAFSPDASEAHALEDTEEHGGERSAQYDQLVNYSLSLKSHQEEIRCLFGKAVSAERGIEQVTFDPSENRSMLLLRPSFLGRLLPLPTLVRRRLADQ